MTEVECSVLTCAVNTFALRHTCAVDVFALRKTWAVDVFALKQTCAGCLCPETDMRCGCLFFCADCRGLSHRKRRLGAGANRGLRAASALRTLSTLALKEKAPRNSSHRWLYQYTYETQPHANPSQTLGISLCVKGWAKSRHNVNPPDAPPLLGRVILSPTL